MVSGISREMAGDAETKRKKRERRKVRKLEAKAKLLTGLEQVQKHNRKNPSTEISKKVTKINTRYHVMQNKYLMSLLDPFNYGAAKIPDFETYYSTTFSVHERYEIPADINGQVAIMFAPWFRNMVFCTMLPPNPGTATAFNWTLIGGTDSKQVSVIGQNYAMARPVSAAIRVTYMGSVLNAQGNIAAALYDPNTALPTSYASLVSSPIYVEKSISGESATLEAHWKPLSFLQSTYVPTTFLPIAQGQTQFWWPSSAGANTASYTQAQWATNPSVGLLLRQQPFQYPFLIVGANGLPTGGPTTTPLIKAEIIVNFEATIQSQTLTLGAQAVTPSPSNIVDLNMASKVMAQMPIAKTPKETSFVEHASQALKGIGSVAETGLNVAKTLSPLIAALL